MIILEHGNYDSFEGVLVRRWGDLRCEQGNGSAFGIVQQPSTVITNTGQFWLTAGMFFCANVPYHVHSGGGLLIEVPEFRCLPSIGGPVESLGRLRYIDGCSDSLLIAPPRRGDPCLNLLHFPAEIKQTMHTHPSLRCGVVLRGSGRCVMPSGELPLTAGMCWVLPTGEPHCFYTDGETMDVVAWHPDSDFGPTDECHPMLNKTFIGGVSASKLDGIRTKEIA